jgi:uncharacterized LabA/DUF88 family protein
VIDKQVKGNVAAEPVTQVMKDLPLYDKAILVSSDGNFACLVDERKKKKKL